MDSSKVLQKPARFDSFQQEAYLNLWRTYDRLRMLEDELFGQYDLTAQQYNALRLLRAVHPNGELTLALAGQLVSRAPDITRLLDKLYDRGLIVRERTADDRRSVRVQLTDAGMALLDDLFEQVRECHERQLGHLQPDELEQLTSLLKRAREPHERQRTPW